MRFIHYILLILSTVLLLHSSNANNIGDANDSIKNILKVQLDTGSFKSERQVLDYLSLTTQLNISTPSEALFYAKALENKLSNEENEIGNAYIHSRKASYYWSQGIFEKALENYFTALALFEEQKDTVEVIKQLNNIGETYKKQKDYKKSAYFLHEALKRINDLKGRRAQLILVNLGQLYMLENKYDSALIYIDKFLSEAEDDNMKALGFANLYKGIIKREQGYFDSAEYYLDKSFFLWEKLASKRYQVETKSELAKLAIAQKKYAVADDLLNESEKVAIKINASDILMKIYLYKIELAKQIKSKDSLSYYYERYISIKDNIFNKEAVSEIDKLGIQYELSKKEKDYYKLALTQNMLANEVKNQANFLIFLLIVILFAVIFILLLWRQRNNLQKAHNKLKNQKEEIEDKQEEIARKSLELANLNKELYSLNQTLEEKIIERSAQLHLKNKQIAKYTYFNSHKLRAPVASILGLINVLELSKNKILDESLLSYLKICAQELDQIIHNLKNILETEYEDIDKRQG